MASLLSFSMAGMERGWMNGWTRPESDLSTGEGKDRSWGKQNKDQIEEIFWFCREFGSVVKSLRYSCVLCPQCFKFQKRKYKNL